MADTKRVSTDDRAGLAQLKQMCRAFRRDMPIDLPLKEIERIAALVSQEPVLRAVYRPEAASGKLICFGNALACVARDGGGARWGWTFHALMTVSGPFAWINHHGIWISPSGDAFDLTPYPSTSKDKPAVDANDRVVFLSDSAANPYIVPGVLRALPIRRFVIGDRPVRALVDGLKMFDERGRAEYEAERQILSRPQ
jgi:hypothetical protein